MLTAGDRLVYQYASAINDRVLSRLLGNTTRKFL